MSYTPEMKARLRRELRKWEPSELENAVKELKKHGHAEQAELVQAEIERREALTRPGISKGGNVLESDKR